MYVKNEYLEGPLQLQRHCDLFVCLSILPTVCQHHLPSLMCWQWWGCKIAV